MENGYEDQSTTPAKFDDNEVKDYVTLACEEGQQEWAHKVIMK